MLNRRLEFRGRVPVQSLRVDNFWQVDSIKIYVTLLLIVIY